MEQVNLFEPAEAPTDEAALEDWALVYLVTRGGGVRGNHFLLRTEDAKAFCSDECSHGIGRGGPWAMMWTSIRHFVHQNDTYDGRLEDFVFIRDTGKQDADFERLGIHKPSLREMCEVLRGMGYVLRWK